MDKKFVPKICLVSFICGLKIKGSQNGWGLMANRHLHLMFHKINTCKHDMGDSCDCSDIVGNKAGCEIVGNIAGCEMVEDRSAFNDNSKQVLLHMYFF